LSEQAQLHGVASIPTKSYCIDFLMLVSNANVCSTHSKRYISSIRSSLTVPNSFPFNVEDLISSINVGDLLIKRSVCLCEYVTRYRDVIYRRIRLKSK
jgi:hypothetical protein